MTPAEHYDRADHLMAKVADSSDPGLPYARALTAQALVHATLATVTPPTHSPSGDHNVDYGQPIDTREPTNGRL